jgi:hypothetical protein
MTAAEELLLQKMRDVSQDHWCAGWLFDLERDLYRIVFCGADPDYGWGPVKPETIARLRELAEECGKWWSWSGDYDEANETLITLEEAHKRWSEFDDSKRPTA